jgi:hypothetical protein
MPVPVGSLPRPASLHCHHLMAAAEGAVDVRPAATGDVKPCEAPRMAAASVSRQTAEAEMDAFT